MRLDRRGSSWNTRIPWRTHPTGLKTLRCFFSVCEPRTVVRVRVRRIVIRIRVSDPAIRIRIVVRPQHHTGAMSVSTCFFVSFYKEAGFAARLCPFRTPVTGGRSRPPRFHAPTELRNDVFTPEGEPRTVARARARRTEIRIRESDPAIRIRKVVRPQHHTGAG